jgi:LemA protein
MFERKMLSPFVFTAIVLLMASQSGVRAQTSTPAARKEMVKDEVYTSVARRLHAATESPVTAIVAEVDGILEVTNVAMEADGKAIAMVQERTPPEGATPSKPIRLKFAPPASGDQWTWVEFEDRGRFYAVEKLFPYVKNELGKRKQLTDAKWAAFIGSIVKQGEVANKLLETTKAIIKSDPPQLDALKNTRNTLTQAIKDNEKDVIVNACLELLQQSESIITLGDTYGELKANDAYLRLLEEYKKSVDASKTVRKEYVQSVGAYNESLVRLPFALVAYGLQFTKIEPNITAE